MKVKIQIVISGVITSLLISFSSGALARTYVYEATCGQSYSKQGEQEEDLTTMKGKSISCNSAILSFLDNGHVIFQVGEKKGQLTPLGFSGIGLDYDTSPNFATLPLDKVYLPHYTEPGTPEDVNGVEGFCFFDGKLNVRALHDVSCVAKIEFGTQRLVYHVDVKILGLGQAVPDP